MPSAYKQNRLCYKTLFYWDIWIQINIYRFYYAKWKKRRKTEKNTSSKKIWKLNVLKEIKPFLYTYSTVFNNKRYCQNLKKNYEYKKDKNHEYYMSAYFTSIFIFFLYFKIILYIY